MEPPYITEAHQLQANATPKSLSNSSQTLHHRPKSSATAAPSHLAAIAWNPQNRHHRSAIPQPPLRHPAATAPSSPPVHLPSLATAGRSDYVATEEGGKAFACDCSRSDYVATEEGQKAREEATTEQHV